MSRSWISLALTFLTCLLLPLAGIWLQGDSIEPYLELPPRTHAVLPAPFSWKVFLFDALIILSGIGWIFHRIFKSHDTEFAKQKELAHRFPQWGWLGFLSLSVGWFFAWNRFEWFSLYQTLTFGLLWMGYLLILNARIKQKTGTAPMSIRWNAFSKLFVLSAIFWWSFEYLNRFVQNWHYLGVDQFNSAEYTLFSTLAFSTVLPGIWMTRETLMTFPSVMKRLEHLNMIPFRLNRSTASSLLILSYLGLVGIAIHPNHLYPVIWIAPLLFLVSVQEIRGEIHLFNHPEFGQWKNLILFALAALICGFFWELWNWKSELKWVYHLPHIQRFHVFEMPLLGFSGYITFGWECAAVGLILMNPSLTPDSTASSTTGSPSHTNR